MRSLQGLLILTCWGTAGAAVVRDINSVHRGADPIATRPQRASLSSAANQPSTRLEVVVQRLPFDALIDQATSEDEEIPAVSASTPVTLELIGVASGTESSAIVSGVPGTDGPTLIRVGARVDLIELLAVAVDRATVRIGGTRRVLRFGEPIEVTP